MDHNVASKWNGGIHLPPLETTAKTLSADAQVPWIVTLTNDSRAASYSPAKATNRGHVLD